MRMTKKYTRKQLEYLSLAINNPLVIELPTLPTNPLIDLLRDVISELAFKLLTKSNIANFRQSKNVNITFKNTEVLALRSAHHLGCLSHLDEYDFTLLHDILFP